MNCDECSELLDGYVDDELTPEQRATVDAHLADCEACRAQLHDLNLLKEHLSMITFREPTDDELERYWQSVYNRLERGAAWVLVSIGAILLGCTGAFLLVEHVIRNPGVGLAAKVGLSALVVGVVVLFVSLLRERLRIRRLDKYSKEIKR